MIFRQLFDPVSSTYTYIFGCETSLEGVIIDTVFEQHARDTALIRELGLTIKYSIDTHVHADHVTGSWLMRDSLGAQTALSAQYGAENVDVALNDGDVLRFGQLALTVMATPGHTKGCLTLFAESENLAFTGDCLLIRGTGRTDFQGGAVSRMWHSINERIFSLPKDCKIYPGHDYLGRTVSTVGEEQAFNPRIGGDAREEDFIGYMANLKLPHPKLLEIAVPANMHLGRPEDDRIPGAVSWGPVIVTFAGVPEIEPDWVASHLDDVFILDVRSPGEFEGDLGHLQGAHLIPLEALSESLADIPDNQPIVAVCQSGKRSAIATDILTKAGFSKVANLEGGLIRWSRLGLPFTA